MRKYLFLITYEYAEAEKFRAADDENQEAKTPLQAAGHPERLSQKNHLEKGSISSAFGINSDVEIG